MRLFHSVIFVATALALAASSSPAQNVSRRFFELQLGQKPPIVVATAATGPLAEQHPFNTETYGKTRGYVPSGSVKEASIVVYTRTLNSNFATLVAHIDVLVAQRGGMESSFINVFDAKGAQRGGYTAEEVVTRLAGLKGFANDNRLKHLSIGLAASPTTASYVGLDDTHDITIVFLAKNKNPNDFSTIAWKRSLHSKELNAKVLAELEVELNGAIASTAK